MNRRTVIRDLTFALGGFTAIPAWAANGWNIETLAVRSGGFNVTENQLLAQIVGTIIPESDTKGAVALGVPAFIEKMLLDCYESPVRDNVKNGLETTENFAKKEFGKSFPDCATPQKQQLLLSFEKGEDKPLKEFYGLVKNLTILGYTTSEYVQTQFLNYNMAPGHFYGCVPVKQ